MDAHTERKIIELVREVCDLIQEKIKSSSAEDHAQLPRLIEALGSLNQSLISKS